jgi:ankyrin repeat protein
MVQLLVDHGCDVNARLVKQGGSPLWMVQNWLSTPNEELANILQENGAIYLDPLSDDNDDANDDDNGDDNGDDDGDDNGDDEIRPEDLEGMDAFKANRILADEKDRKLEAKKATKKRAAMTKWKHNVQNAVNGKKINTVDVDTVMQAVVDGNVDKLTLLIETHPSCVDLRDDYGWQPLHEAIRFDQVEIVQLLVDYGCDVNARIGETEESPLWMVERIGGTNAHEMSDILREYGAISFPPSKENANDNEDENDNEDDDENPFDADDDENEEE